MVMPQQVIKLIQEDINALVWAKDPDFRPMEDGTPTNHKRWMTEKAGYIPWGKGGLGITAWNEHLNALYSK
jgi:hypothetical protein